jgi:hypothetical protein
MTEFTNKASLKPCKEGEYQARLWFRKFLGVSSSCKDYREEGFISRVKELGLINSEVYCTYCFDTGCCCGGIGYTCFERCCDCHKLYGAPNPNLKRKYKDNYGIAK